MKYITTDDLKQMTRSEGLILQGCGGDPQEWVDGINELLAEQGILQNGAKFTDIFFFEHNGLQNIMFGMDDMNSESLSVGKLAIWRLQTHSEFGGTWLSDYLPNSLGVSLENETEPDTREDEHDSPPIVAFGARPNHYRDGFYSDGPHKDDPLHSTPDLPLQVYIENADHPEFGGFTMPLPTTHEVIQPFLDGIEIIDISDAAIKVVNSSVDFLAFTLDSLAEKGLNLDELSYLAAKVRALSDSGIEILSAALEAGRHSGSMAGLINLTENLDRFDLLPAFSDEQYGEFLIDYGGEEHADVFNRLNESDDQNDREMAKYIEKLEKFTNKAAFGRAAIEEENGILTNQGLLLGGDDFKTVYRGPQDIPAEYRLFVPNANERDNRALTKVEGADLGALLMAAHAVGGEYMRDAKHNVSAIANGGTDYFIKMYPGMIAVARVEDVYHRDTSEHAQWVPEGSPSNRAFLLSVMENDGGRVVGNLYEIELAAFQANIRENSFFFTHIDAEMKDGSNRRFTLSEWDAMDRFERGQLKSWMRHYDPADEARLNAFIGSLRRTCDKNRQTIVTGEFLKRIAAPYMTSANNPQPDMLRVAWEAAKGILARNDAEVYRLIGSGAVKLSPIDVVKSDGLAYMTEREFAVKSCDIAGVEKWAIRAAGEILRQAERGEHKKSHDTEY